MPKIVLWMTRSLQRLLMYTGTSKGRVDMLWGGAHWWPKARVSLACLIWALWVWAPNRKHIPKNSVSLLRTDWEQSRVCSPRELRVSWPHASQQATPRGQPSRQPVISSLVSTEYSGSTQCIMELTERPPFTFMICNAFISVAHESFQSRRPGCSRE